MTKCVCGKDVRLRACKIRVYQRSGIINFIEHMDGTRVCVPGKWSCAELKPYRAPRQAELLVERWQDACRTGEKKGA